MLTILQGDALTELQKLPAKSAHCCVTSVPYWQLRDYKVAGQIGLEKTPEEWAAKLVSVFREVRHVLRKDGTAWINVGDSWASGGRGGNPTNDSSTLAGSLDSQEASMIRRHAKPPEGLKAKDLIGLPWLLAFALRADGWWLRSEIIWHKKNCLPESVSDRPTKAHEQIFLLSNSARYYYDAKSIMEPCSKSTHARVSQDVANQAVVRRPNSWHNSESYDGQFPSKPQPGVNPKAMIGNPGRQNESFSTAITGAVPLMRNKRSVWSVPTKGTKDAHFATFPPDLIKPCILAGCPAGGTVLDPFFGSGTTGIVALELGRSCIGIELSQDYCKIAESRCNVTPGLPL